jgi:hypothetical protein
MYAQHESQQQRAGHFLIQKQDQSYDIHPEIAIPQGGATNLQLISN